MSPTFYAPTPADALVAIGRATRTALAPAQPTPDPLPTYAQVRAPTPGVLASAPTPLRYVFHDALVHGPEGPVTVGRHVVQETLLHVRSRAGFQGHGPLWLAPAAIPTAHLPEAAHLLAGNPANYFHWLLDGIARWPALPPGSGPVLVPATAPFHAGLPAILPEAAPRLRPVTPHETIAVRRLAWTTHLHAFGGAYHQAILRLRDAAAPTPPELPHLPANIYVARTDAPNRPLRNEPAVARLAESRGFTPVTLSNLPLAHQVALFRHARRIVAPHGAGLANILFCRPGAAILELMMDQYANFCFRRLAAAANLRWGALVGRSEPGDPRWVHATGWTLDLDRLAAALDDPAFHPKDPPP